MQPGASIHWRTFDGQLCKGRFLRFEGPLAIVEYASGDQGIDRTTCCHRDEIQDPAEEKRRRKLAEIDMRQAAEVQRHQAELRLIARERESLL